MTLVPVPLSVAVFVSLAVSLSPLVRSSGLFVSAKLSAGRQRSAKADSPHAHSVAAVQRLLEALLCMPRHIFDQRHRSVVRFFPPLSLSLSLCTQTHSCPAASSAKLNTGQIAAVADAAEEDPCPARPRNTAKLADVHVVIDRFLSFSG